MPLALPPVIDFPCEFRPPLSGLGAPVSRFGGEKTTGSPTNLFFCPTSLAVDFVDRKRLAIIWPGTNTGAGGTVPHPHRKGLSLSP